jgi:transposase
MTTKRINMIKLKELLRLKHEAGLSVRQIALSLSLSIGAISKYLNRAKAAGIGWPLPADLSDQSLLAILQPRRTSATALVLTEPDYAQMAVELKTKGMTRQLLWEEYAEAFPDNHYCYSRFTVLFRQWHKKQQLSMRQTHRVAEKLFVDYCGPTLAVVNPDSGEIRSAQVFVSVLGASSYTFAEATWSQSLPDWIGSHVRAFEFYGGVPEVVVPDNLKSAVSKACRYDPVINPSYQQLAEYYGVAVIPARPYKPKDKSKAEVGVQIVERWIMMRLRKQTFYTLSSINLAIRLLLDELNRRPFKKKTGSRLSQFEQLDRPALRALPNSPYVYRHIKKARVHLDYHVEYNHHYYSVPYQLVKEEVMIHAGEHLLEIFYQGKQVANHPRVYHHGGHSTNPDHLSKAHRAHQQWSPTRFLQWASDIGPNTEVVIRHQLESRRHPEHGYRACLGLLNLAKKYGKQRLENACHRAHHIGGMQYKNIASILSKSLDKLPIESESTEPTTLPLFHDNVRGPDYYH